MEITYEVEVVLGFDSQTQKRKIYSINAPCQSAAVTTAVQTFNSQVKFGEFEPMYIRCVSKERRVNG